MKILKYIKRKHDIASVYSKSVQVYMSYVRITKPLPVNFDSTILCANLPKLHLVTC